MEVMGRFGHLLKFSTGTADTYQLSSETSSLDDFISHNWSTGRFEKFFTLAIHYNRSTAVIAAWSTGLLFSGLTMAGYMPIFTNHPKMPGSISANLSGNIVFFLTLFGKQEVQRLLCRLGLMKRRRMVFLDKVCIHQTNEKLKKQGIQSLAGFLRQSRNIVLVYKDTYIRKLWTVYEVSSFLMMHQDCSRIKVLPTLWSWHWASMVIGVILLNVAYWVAYLLTTSKTRFIVATINSFSAVGLALWVACCVRRWHVHLDSMVKDIESFDIREAACLCESDREVVQANVCAFLHCLGRVASPDVKEESLDEFDRAVREDLPRSLKASIGTAGYPYQMVATGSMLFVLAGFDQVAAEVLVGHPLTTKIAALVYNFALAFLINPIGMHIFSVVLRRRLHLRGWRENLLLLVCLLPVIFLWATGYVLRMLVSSAEGWKAWMFCAILLGYCALLAAWNWKAYRPKQSVTWTSSLALEPETTAPEEENSSFADSSAALESYSSSVIIGKCGLLQASGWKQKFRGELYDDCSFFVKDLQQSPEALV